MIRNTDPAVLTVTDIHMFTIPTKRMDPAVLTVTDSRDLLAPLGRLIAHSRILCTIYTLSWYLHISLVRFCLSILENPIVFWNINLILFVCSQVPWYLRWTN